jgi:hypothetical protein
MITGVGIFGLLLGLLSVFFATRLRTRLRIGVFLALYVTHVLAAVAYYQLVQTSVADTYLYYFDPYGIYDQEGFGSNTILIIALVQFPKSYFGGSYLDYFLVFQAVGFFGLAALMRVFEEVYQEMEVDQPFYTYLILFMPSIHYWTSAIGKDSLFFFGLCITFWAAMNHKRRFIVFGAGLLLMLAIRPHIAIVAGAAFTLAVLIDKNTRMLIKVPLFAAGLAVTAYAAISLRSTFGIDVTNVDVFSDVLAGRDALLTTEDAGRSVVSGSFFFLLISLLFRPFFFDAPGAFGFVASVENLGVLAFIVTLFAFGRTVLTLFRRVPFVRYTLVATVMITFVLTLGYYNVGLGIRQKATMILPGLMVLFVTTLAYRRAQRIAEVQPPIVVGHPSLG